MARSAGMPMAGSIRGRWAAVLTPSLVGIDKTGLLPNASTFCGRCESVCPVKIPLPKLMRHWREREFERHLTPGAQRSNLAPLGLVRPAAHRLSLGDEGGDRRARAARARQGRLPLAAAGRRLDRGPRPADAGTGRHLHGALCSKRRSGRRRAMTKEAILGAIRRGLKRGPLPADQQAMLAGRLATHPRHLIPARSPAAAARPGRAVHPQRGEGIRHGRTGAGPRRRAGRAGGIPGGAEPALPLRHGAAPGIRRHPLGRPPAAGNSSGAAPRRPTRSACSMAGPRWPRPGR